MISCRLRFLTMNLNFVCKFFRHSNKNTFKVFKSLSSVAIAEYPEIKPKFPPGQWSIDMPENVCWEIYETGQNLKQIPTVKERLEKFAGSEQKWMVNLSDFDTSPQILDYKQYITKTHVVNALPLYYESAVVDNIYEQIKPQILGAISHSLYFYEDYRPKIDDLIDPKVKDSHIKTHTLLASMINVLLSRLCTTSNYLRRSQVDENVRIETWFKRYGFADDDKPVKDKWNGLATVQFKGMANYQIRSELPILEFLPHFDKLCMEGAYPSIDYSPMAIGQPELKGRPLTVSGHWIGDPCEFSRLSIYVMPPRVHNDLAVLGTEYLEEGTLAAGLTASFGACLAQAHNQGFNWLFDVTYPFTTQTIVVRDNWFRLCCYQLNTTQLWKDDTANPLRNILWASEEMKLFDSVSTDGKVVNFNDNLCKMLLKFFLIPSTDRGGINLRPYLPNDPAPRNTHLYINHVGNELLPYMKIGRYQYPKNALYF